MQQRPRLLFGMIEAYGKDDKQRSRSSKVDLGLERLEAIADWNTRSRALSSIGVHGLLTARDEAKKRMRILHSEGLHREHREGGLPYQDASGPNTTSGQQIGSFFLNKLHKVSEHRKGHTRRS
jgi:hypothetical protein